MVPDNRVLRRRLFDILCNRFDLEELRTLCFLLDVSYDGLRGEGQTAKARELVRHAQNRELFPLLVEEGKGLRPDVDWPDVAGPDDPTTGRTDARRKKDDLASGRCQCRQ